MRGIGLIVVAVVLGVVLLNATDSPEPFRVAANEDDSGDSNDGATPTDEGDDTPSSTPALPQPHDPAEVAVLVANGTGGQVRGAAGRVAEQIQPENYIMKSPTNTKTASDASMVYFQPGYEGDASRVAGLLTPAPGVQPMPDPVPVDDLQGAHLLVVVAADLAGG